MFYIDQSSAEFKHALQEHFVNVRYIIKKKLLGTSFTEPHPKGLTTEIKKVNGIHSTVSTFLKSESNLKNVIIGTPEVLDKIKLKFTTKKEIESIKKLFNYTSFIDKKISSTFGFYNAYNLAENLNIQTCVYCNRLYTNTIITSSREFIARPTFDHWFLKSKYPLLALSFYNLVPSCNICNSSVKGSGINALDKIFHPYLKHNNVTKLMDFSFSYTLENHLTAVSKLIAKNKFTTESLNAMKIADIYHAHTEEIRDLIYLKKAYSETYLASLSSILKISVSNHDVYKLAFGVYIEDSFHIRRPLSKLKKDILSELGILS